MPGRSLQLNQAVRARLDTPIDPESTKRIKISICGQVFVTQEKTASTARARNTRLYRMLTDKSLADGYDEAQDVYFFDRHLPSFPAILYFYQTGFIWRPLDVPMEVFVEEVIFYGLADRILAPLGDEDRNKQILFCMGGKRTLCVQSREAIWNLFEKPETSLLAKVINVLSIFFILLSTISFCLETIPFFQEGNCYPGVDKNGTPVRYQMKDYNPESNTFPFWVIETICITFFTIEYVLRFWSAPDRCRFVPEFMNLVDLAAIVPYYITIIFDASINKTVLCMDDKTTSSSSTDNGSFLMILRVIRLARIVRIAKLSRHSRNLSTLIKTMKTSLRELSFLMLFFIVSMVLFATFVYFCEVADNPNMFPSIPASFWWAIVTMTTVGYGDTYPITALGKVVGFLCTICGVLCIALPVPSIVSNFHRLYQEDQIMNPHGNHKYKSKDEEVRCKLRKKFLADV
ncbi:Oidioi.mRNA.OKI2018_I69.PAR.g10165.t2.cds [Oikopleura dioica]|uniref:Oidioi.mRNA.OKI2018_I69.PAR.g10165.t2.cds n=1 Tax=Oikopleura dioica TaxID=34765 RepID=A0ABN7RT87_OIKDI|nr:Oidioi.mRNA.OKI2018_I69.PAR.g10165.t2.cds [Oikopleura dioica]